MPGGAHNCLKLTYADYYCHNLSFLQHNMYRTLNFKEGTNNNDRKIKMRLNNGIHLKLNTGVHYWRLSKVRWS